ncbi:amidohydrolase family protein [Streptomyces sp. NPDC047072]|uniref:amidohydrolase family protein n=1 Tax=Streptomyces sp. NPDC047072 TaxID=3154809 RepID=UPI0033FA3E65
MIIRNVTVVDGTGGEPLTGAEVEVADGRFTAVRPATTQEPAIDGKGGWLVPGLWESHTHLSGLAFFQPAEKRVGHVSEALAGFVRAGITSVVNLGGPLDLELAVREHRRIATDPAAELYFAGPVFTGIGGWPVLDNAEMAAAGHQIDDPDVAYRLALELAEQTDVIKCIYDGEPGSPTKLPRAALRAVAAAAHEKGRKVLVHVCRRVDLEEAVEAGADCIEHAFLPEHPDSDEEAADMAKLLAENGTLYCPTLVTWEQLGRNGEAAYLEELVADGVITADDIPRITGSPFYGRAFPHHPADECRVRFDYAMRTLRMMHDAGVEIVAGSDVSMMMPSPPVALLRELQLLAKAGLPLPAVLAAGTRHAAGKIGLGGEAGTITQGAVADAVLLDADPLTDVAHLVNPAHHIGVLRKGRFLTTD